MPGIDLRVYKKKLREEQKSLRRALTPDVKAAMDAKITESLISSKIYRDCEAIMIYVSTPIEVDTHGIINAALSDGKKVAVPRCITQSREMEFHYISSLSELSPGAYGLLEPSPNAPVAHGSKSSLLVVPALSFDRAGYRLGYGGGYYDRYISGFNGTTLGICYRSDLKQKLLHGKFDRRVQLILTESLFALARE